MQPNARKNSHRGISRSVAPCSASNNHRVADESHSMITNNYDTNSEDPKGIGLLDPALLNHCLFGASIWDLVILPDTCAGLARSERSHPPPSACINCTDAVMAWVRSEARVCWLENSVVCATSTFKYVSTPV